MNELTLENTRGALYKGQRPDWLRYVYKGLALPFRTLATSLFTRPRRRTRAFAEIMLLMLLRRMTSEVSLIDGG